MSRRSRPARAFIVAASFTWMLAPAGVAKDQAKGADAAAPEEVTNAPAVFVLGFVDDSEVDCDPIESRFGRCVEDVSFMPTDLAWKDKGSVPQLRQLEWQNTSSLYAEMWEDLAFRWSQPADPIITSLVARQITDLPPAKQQWQATFRDPDEPDRSIYALPRGSSWLGPGQWIDPRTWSDHATLTQQELQQPTDAIFAAVRWGKPTGLVPAQPYVILKGRFAARLAAENRLHPYDIMDADTVSSAPMFEQMYPYRRAYSEGDGSEDQRSEIPLSLFRASDALREAAFNESGSLAERQRVYEQTLLSRYNSFDASERFSTDQFETFYDLIGTQILRFAREEYTPTHIRVLAALMAMESPPTSLSDGYVTSDAVVAAASGQMDTIDPMTTEFSGFASSRDGFAINTLALPNKIVDLHLGHMDDWNNPGRGFRTRLFIALVEELGDHLDDRMVNLFQRNPQEAFRRTGRMNKAALEIWVQENMRSYLLPDRLAPNAAELASGGAAPAPYVQWSKENAFDGREQIVQGLFKRVALDLILSEMDEAEREILETRILLDHLNFEIRRGFGGADAPTATPAAVEERAKGAWLSVLHAHGMYPDAIPDRPGVVNPLAICTVNDKLKALEEPAFGRINLDQVVIARAGLEDADELLWEIRERVPFFMVDDPRNTAPEVTKLFDVPASNEDPDTYRSVYRIRWKLWSGWHMLWGVESLNPDDPDSADARRVALRTGAICADTVLADPDLVPIVLRAAMLDGKFRPAVPVYDAERVQREVDRTNDQLVIDGTATKNTVDTQKGIAGTIAAAVSGDTTAQVDTARAGIGAVANADLRQKDRSQRRISEESDPVLYVQDLVYPPLRQLGASKPTLAMIFDHGHPGEREPIWSFRPKTPYAQTQRRFVVDKAGGEAMADAAADEAPERTKTVLPGHDGVDTTERAQFLRSAAWSYVLQPPDALVPSIPISPAYTQTELLTTRQLRQQWKRRRTSDWYFGGSLGFVPYKRVAYACSEGVDEQIDNWAGFVEHCGVGKDPKQFASETQGIHLALDAVNTQWIAQDRRFGVEFGPEIQLDVLQRGRSVFQSDTPVYGITRDDDITEDEREELAEAKDIGQPINRSWAVRFQAGIVAGVHFVPNPSHLWRTTSRRYPWGAPLPDGSATLGRFEWGLRGGLLIGPTGDGFEGTFLTEWWGGWSVRFAGGPQASFTSYQPNVLLGPFVRGQVGFPMVADKNNYLILQHTGQIVVGLRAQFRLLQQPEFKVEAPK
jgi:hypothetical protein